MSTMERVRILVEPIVAATSADLYDLELTGGVLRVVVDQPGGVGMDLITVLTREISRALDDADPIPERFTLEVSSPGLERALRRPAHFQSAIGTTVSVKTVPGTPGERRVRGTISSADDDGFVLVPDPTGDAEPPEPRRLSYADVERARTVFEWGPAPRPNSPNHRTKKQAKQKKVIAS